MPARYRAEQVGSLLRPAELLQARAAYAQAKISLNELREKEDQAIVQVFERRMQQALDGITLSELGA